ncbi:hypothetical protein [Pontibacter oryzae]|uniref:hypothetical protein n=1 Tax=Pontibacter oryzae TaxID=2304593 RepID=UPI0011C3F2F1|nr:hypothetical protein [Pontibacter oryzae]
MWRRYFIGISILVIYLMTTFRYLVPLVHYQLDYAYISEVLCINRDQPQLQCHGTCHLRKKINALQTSQQQQDAVQHLLHAFQPVEAMPHSQQFVPIFVKSGILIQPDFHLYRTCTTDQPALFHPPQQQLYT